MGTNATAFLNGTDDGLLPPIPEEYTDKISLAFAPAFTGDYGRITHAEALTIMRRAAVEAKRHFNNQKVHGAVPDSYPRHNLESPPECYPCYDERTRDFFYETYAQRASWWSEEGGKGKAKVVAAKP